MFPMIHSHAGSWTAQGRCFEADMFHDTEHILGFVVGQVRASKETA